jgi:hypothetical protein
VKAANAVTVAGMALGAESAVIEEEIAVIVVRVRKETDHKEIVRVVETVVPVHLGRDHRVHRETVRHVRWVIVVRVRKETDHRDRVEIALKATVRRAPRAHRATVRRVRLVRHRLRRQLNRLPL